MIVVLSGDALADLDEIGIYIARDDALRGERFVEAIRRRCATLRRNPNRFPVTRHAGDFDIRKFGFRRYLIFYAVHGGEVQVLRILHGSRDWAGLFADEV